MKPFLFAPIILFVVAGSSAARPKNDFSAQATAIIKAWETAYNDQKDAAKAASIYSDDALLSTSGGSIEGRANIQGVLQRGIDSGEKITDLKVTRARSSGSIGFAAGTYTAYVNGKPHPGHFMVAFEKVSGKWLISAQTAVPLPENQ